jgi:hypothetical protein
MRPCATTLEGHDARVSKIRQSKNAGVRGCVCCGARCGPGATRRGRNERALRRPGGPRIPRRRLPGCPFGGQVYLCTRRGVRDSGHLNGAGRGQIGAGRGRIPGRALPVALEAQAEGVGFQKTCDEMLGPAGQSAVAGAVHGAAANLRLIPEREGVRHRAPDRHWAGSCPSLAGATGGLHWQAPRAGTTADATGSTGAGRKRRSSRVVR